MSVSGSLYASTSRAPPKESRPIYTFSPGSRERALPLSSALLRENPGLSYALHNFRAASASFHATFTPRADSIPAAAFVQDEEDEDGWGDDEDGYESSEAGDEWETGEFVDDDDDDDGGYERGGQAPHANTPSHHTSTTGSATPELQPPSTASEAPRISDSELDDPDESLRGVGDEAAVDRSFRRALQFSGWAKVEPGESWSRSGGEEVEGVRRLLESLEA